MANMSYCRFENTSNDLGDCLVALEEEEDVLDDLNDYERVGVKNLLRNAHELLQMYEEGTFDKLELDLDF